MQKYEFTSQPVVKSYDVPTSRQPIAPAPSAKVPSRGRRFLKWTLIIVATAIVVLGALVAARALDLSNKIFVGDNSSFYKKLASLIQSQTSGTKLIGEKDGQINMLLLGIGGAEHEGSYLTDTMMVAQIRPGDKKATLIAIPRDHLVNVPALGGQRKINAVFAETFAKNKDWNEAGKATREVVEQLSGLAIPYFAVVDFKGFEKTIDLIGGVDVQVERTFTDYEYPDENYGYLAPVTFQAGQQHMDGKRSLIFARSRHAAGPEGSDFARGARQQKIITAAKDKVIQLNLITDLGKLNELAGIVGDHMHTNVTPGELFHLYELSKEFHNENVASLSLDPVTGLLCPEILESNGAYVLVVCSGKTSADVKKFFSQSFTTGKLSEEKAIVWLADSTVTQKLYKAAEKKLQDAGVTVYKVIYTGTALDQSVVYAVNDKPATVALVKDELDASPVSLPPPGIKIDKNKVDLVIILGE